MCDIDQILSMLKEDPMIALLESTDACWGDILMSTPPKRRKFNEECERRYETDSDSDSDSDMDSDAEPEECEHILEHVIEPINVEDNDPSWAPVKNKKKVGGNKKQSSTLILRNIPRDITNRDIENVFKKYGNIVNIHLPRNTDKSSPYYGTLRGFAFVEFQSADDANEAFESEFNRLQINYNKISIEIAESENNGLKGKKLRMN